MLRTCSLSVASPYPTKPFDPGAGSLDQCMRVLRGDDKARLGDIWHVDELFITIRGERHLSYPSDRALWYKMRVSTDTAGLLKIEP